LRTGTLLAAVAVGAMIAFWAYLLFVADPETPDQLDDPAFGERGQAICAPVLERIDALPPATEATSPQDRAVSVSTANRLLGGMIDELEAAAPTEGEDARLVGLWLDDWRTYLADRGDYAEALAAGEDVELLVTPRGHEQITITVDNFARVNDMPACATPLDA